MHAARVSPPSDHIHPALWRATELAGHQIATQPCGHPALDAELPGGGWPVGSLTELILSQPGIGELRLLAPALTRLAPQRPIVLLQPPYSPNSVCCSPGTYADRWLWISPQRAQDAPWAAEQILKNGSCAALLYWENAIHTTTLRRLHLAAQTSDMLFFMLRPIQAAKQASPAPLRLQLHPAPAGLHIDMLKRRGPAMNAPLLIDLPTPAPHVTPHAPLDRPAPVIARSPLLVTG